MDIYKCTGLMLLHSPNISSLFRTTITSTTNLQSATLIHICRREAQCHGCAEADHHGVCSRVSGTSNSSFPTFHDTADTQAVSSVGPGYCWRSIVREPATPQQALCRFDSATAQQARCTIESLVETDAVQYNIANGSSASA